VSSPAEDSGAALIREAFDLFNRAQPEGRVDREELVRAWDPDVRHVTRFTALEGRGYEGYEGLEEFIAESHQQFERFDVRLERILGDGDSRVAIYTADALTRETGVPIEQRLAMTVELRDGRLYRTKVYVDPREALQESGLDPALAD
jgi:ketosteroid isomerase-like protein